MSISNNAPIEAPQVFSQMLQGLGENAEDNYIYLQNGAVQQEGSFGHVFTRTKVNIATTQALQAEVRARFGEDVGDALKPRFETLIRAGKQMKVSDVRKLVEDAKTTKTFKDYGRDLETRYGHTVAEYLRPTLDAMAAAGNSLEVVRETLEAGAQDILQDLGKLEAKIDTFAESHANWSEPDKADFKAAMRAALEVHPDLMETRVDSEGLTAFEKIQRNVANVLDGLESADSVFRTVKDPDTRRDLLTLTATWLGQTPSLHRLALEHLPQMRSIEPTGTLSAQTVALTLFNTKLPASYNGLGATHSQNAMFFSFFKDMVNRESKLGNSGDEFNNVDIFMSNGVPYDDALKRAGEVETGEAEPQPIDFSRVAFEQNLTFNSPVTHTVEAAESQFFGSEGAEADFQRMYARDANKVFRTAQFTVHNGAEQTTVTNAGEAEQKNASAQTLKDSLKALCGENTEQYRVLVWAMTQASPLEVAARSLSEYMGIRMNEHMPLNVDVSRDSAGNVRLTMALPEGFGATLAASYTIHPDGTSETTRFEFAPATEARVQAELAKHPEWGSAEQTTYQSVMTRLTQGADAISFEDSHQIALTLLDKRHAMSEEMQQTYCDTMRYAINHNPRLRGGRAEEVGSSNATQNVLYARTAQNLLNVLQNNEGAGEIYGMLSAQDRVDLLKIGTSYMGLVLEQPGYQMYILGALSEMRDAHPDGAFSRDTLVKTLFPEATKEEIATLHAQLDDPDPQEGSLALKHALTARENALSIKAGVPESGPERAMYDFQAFMFVSSGIPYPMARERATTLALSPEKGGRGASIDFSKVVFSPALDFHGDDYSIEGIEKQLAKDFSRMACNGHYSDFTLTDAQGQAFVFTNAPSETNPNAIEENRLAFVEATKRLCGTNTEQSRVLLAAASQGTPLQKALKLMSAYIGGQFDEHSALKVDMKQAENGDITLTLKLNDNPAFDVHASYVVHTDGTSETVDFVMASQSE